MNRNHKCQLHCVNIMSEGVINLNLPFHVRLRLTIRRHLSTRMKRRIKKFIEGLVSFFSRFSNRHNDSSTLIKTLSTKGLKAGDLIRIRSKEEIDSTLNRWRTLKGCAFMSVMEPYCNTIQRVFKPVTRFVDERDYRVKKSKGIYILEGIMCQGTPSYGCCDRSCFFFWREEWLERIEEIDEDNE